MNNYFHLLFESAWMASIIPFGDEPTFFAMQAFGGFDMRLAAAVSVAGGTAGHMFNWWVGSLLMKLKNKKGIVEAWDAKIMARWNTYGVYLLLLCWVPLGKMLPVIAGFLGTRPRTAFIIILLGEIFNYGRYAV